MNEESRLNRLIQELFPHLEDHINKGVNEIFLALVSIVPASAIYIISTLPEITEKIRASLYNALVSLPPEVCVEHAQTINFIQENPELVVALLFGLISSPIVRIILGRKIAKLPPITQSTIQTNNDKDETSSKNSLRLS